MGHREDLLEGAQRCLLEKGFARTSARDIVKESGTNLASIGYHYGSKDKLLAQAYVALMEQVGDRFEAPDPGVDLDGAPGSVERFEEVWRNVLTTFRVDRAIWMLSLELVTLGERMPELSAYVGRATVEARRGLLPLFQGGAEPDADDPAVDTLGGLYALLLNGLMVQWLFDPESATDAGQLAEGMRRLMAAADGAK